MQHAVEIARKDLLQLVRGRKIFLFALVMPLVFTVLFGFAQGALGPAPDSRLPLGWLDEDNSTLSRNLRALLARSDVVRLVERGGLDRSGYAALVADGKLAAAVIVPPRYGRCLLHGKRPRLTLIGDPSTPAVTSIQSEVISKLLRLENATRTAVVMEEVLGETAAFDYIFKETLARWDDPPIRVVETTSSILSKTDNRKAVLAHTSPGMMLQFAIASLLTAAQIIVDERRSRSLQRMLTTSARRIHILAGHYLAILACIALQFLALILFAQLVLGLDYLRAPLAVALLALSAAACIAAMGVLIGMLARSPDQAVTFSLVPMFVLSALGGAWVPLEFAGRAFQTIGHLSPIAWAMDGFKAVAIRGLGLPGVIIPSLALLGYAALFFFLAWRRLCRE